MVSLIKALLLVRILVLHLWQEVLVFLLAWPLTEFSQLHNHIEVVRPLRVSGTGSQMSPQGLVSYSMNFGGRKHIVHLRTNRFLVSRHFSVFSYNDQGALHEDQPFIQKDCYYHGYVEGEPDSMVALTTCLGGFRGTLQINNTTYEIKPKSVSSTFEHLVYKMDSEETQLLPKRCGLTKEEIERQLKLRESDSSVMMQSGYEGWWTHESLIEIALVVDKNRYVHRGSNITAVQEEVLNVVNAINGYYAPLQMEFVIRGLEVWSDQNKIRVETGIDNVLQTFCLWKLMNFYGRVPHDVVHLFARHVYPGILGIAYVGTICNDFNNCGVDSFVTNDLVYFGYIVAHELGHNLGMQHDDNECTCGGNLDCIMAPRDSEATKFSNCSYAVAWTTSMQKKCIRNIPRVENTIKTEFCGNGVVENGEVCDCGNFDSCIRDPCCLEGCTLKRGANCSIGGCCKDCVFMPSGTVCREKENECDLPEWCNGTSQECPHDVYIQDWSPCKGGGYCYKKRCNDREEQCRQIFGNESRSASQVCYAELNSKGDRFGNCGITRDSYLCCNASDTLCGRIVCDNVTEIPRLRDHSTVHWHQFQGFNCWGTDYHWGMTIPDVGYVNDGTGCGTNRVCLKKSCVPVPHLTWKCSQATCNLNGVCNNQDHCHCNVGWGPPNCQEGGDGGSVDSGPPPRRKQEERRKNSYFILYWLIPFWVVAFFLLFWPCMVNRPVIIQKKKVNAPISPEKVQPNIQSASQTGLLSAQSSPEKEQPNVQSASQTGLLNAEYSPEKEQPKAQESPEIE